MKDLKDLAVIPGQEQPSASGREDAPSMPFSPDDVLSVRRMPCGPPLGLDGPDWLLRFLRRLTGKKPIVQSFVLWIVYSDWSERTRIVRLDPGRVHEVAANLLEAKAVRSVRVAELLFESHKSFGRDFDPANWKFPEAAPSQPASADDPKSGMNI